MLILTLRTDKPDSEVGLYDDAKQIAYEIWPAHRQLAETIHKKIDILLSQHAKQLSDITGIAIYEGPGSFTGLRIGMSVANALASSYSVPIVARSGDDWIEQSCRDLLDGLTDVVALPEYGASANITAPKK